MRKAPQNPIIEAWIAQVSKALLRHENRARANNVSPLLSEENTKVFISAKGTNSLRLMNLKVWTQRYCVSIDFVLEVLLEHYARIRTRPKPGVIWLGLPIRMLTGEKSRTLIEQAVVEAFPNGENYIQARFEETARYRTLAPVTQMKYESFPEMQQRYSQIMLNRHKSKPPVFVRKYRRVKNA